MDTRIEGEGFKSLENAFRLKGDDKGLYRSIGRANQEKSLPYDEKRQFY